jgi:alpha-1,2-mannosyltransferase
MRSMHGLVDGSRHATAALMLDRLRLLASMAPQLSRYTLVSAAALAADFAIYLALTSLAMRPFLAGMVGYTAGMLLHYLFSIRFVFDPRATAKAHPRLLGEFVITGLCGIAVTALVIAAATDALGLAPLPAKVLAAGASFLVVFALRRGVVFSACAVCDGTPVTYGRPFVRASVWRAMEVMRGWYGRLNQRALAPDFYAKFTVAGAVFFAVLEVTYFLFSDPPSFWKPSLDAFGHTAIGRDFLNAWMGGRSALGEGPAAWFDFRVYNQFLAEFMGVSDMHSYVWSYPPHVLLFLWPLGLLPYFPAFLLWTLGGFAVFLYAARIGGVERRHLLFVAVAPAVAINVFIGQNGFFTAALLICGLASLDRRPVLSGVLFGILTIKPQLGLLLPVVLVLTGRWRAIVSAVITTAALVAATAWLYGPEIWTEFLAKVVPQQRYLQEHGDGLLYLQIPSAFYAARHVGLPLGFAWALQALMSAGTVAAVVWTYWRRRDPVLSTALLIIAIFLVSPYTLNYDMVILGWVLALLRQRGGNEPVDHYLIMALWTLPAAMMIAGLIYIPLAVLVLSAFAARLVWQLAHSEARERASPMLGAKAAATPAA